jgi:hypothetical protein
LIDEAWDFTKVLDWFRNDKIDVNYDVFIKKNTMRFSHPSYYEAFQYAISENRSPTKPGKILSSVLLKIADDKKAAYAVARAVAANFDKLPDNVRNLLFKLADDNEAAYYVAKSVAANFDKIPENVRNEILLKLAENKGSSWYISNAISRYSDKVSDNVRNEILRKLKSIEEKN